MTGDPTTAAAHDPLLVRSVAVDLDTGLLDLLPADAPVSWLRKGEGLVGWGVAARIDTNGSTRFRDADKWWKEQVARAEVHDEIGEPGSGLVCFGTFAFADEPGTSTLVVPQVVVGRRGDRCWMTVVGDASPDLVSRSGEVDAPSVSFADGSVDGEAWMSVVADAVARINNGDLEKVVLARDLVATADEDVDVRWPLRRSPRTTRCAGSSTSTASSAPPPSSWSAASAAW